MVKKDEYRKLDEIPLIEKCREGDIIALEELIKRHERVVYLALYHLEPTRSDIADMAQEVLIKMAKSIKNLRNPASFKFWLNQIITNYFYDELRRKSRRIQTLSIDEAISEEENAPSREIADVTKHPEKKSLDKELDIVIKKSIEELPEQFRLVIVLRELQGLSYDEIAKMTGAGMGTVKSRLARARDRLQKKILPYLT